MGNHKVLTLDIIVFIYIATSPLLRMEILVGNMSRKDPATLEARD